MFFSPPEGAEQTVATLITHAGLRPVYLGDDVPTSSTASCDCASPCPADVAVTSRTEFSNRERHGLHRCPDGGPNSYVPALMRLAPGVLSLRPHLRKDAS